MKVVRTFICGIFLAVLAVLLLLGDDTIPESMTREGKETYLLVFEISRQVDDETHLIRRTIGPCFDLTDAENSREATRVLTNFLHKMYQGDYLNVTLSTKKSEVITKLHSEQYLKIRKESDTRYLRFFETTEGARTLNETQKSLVAEFSRTYTARIAVFQRLFSFEK